MSVNVLPDMDEPRLKALGKQLNRNRKTSLISHDKLKDELDVYNKSLSKEMKSLDGKYQTKGMRLKHKLARVRGTQKCLKQKREQSFYIESGDHPYGVYDGENLHTYRREIDEIIDRKHPKYRRQRKVEKCMENCKASGQIMDDEDIKMQFDFIMTKSYNDDDDISTYMKRENPLSLTFLAGAKGGRKDWTWKSPNAPLSMTKTKVRNWLKPQKSGRTSEADDVETPASSRLGKATPRSLTSADTVSDQLISMKASNVSKKKSSRLSLPPIMARKQLMKKDSVSQKTSLSLPNLAIRRATKCDTISKEDVDKLSRLKNRRMTTII